MNWVSYFERNRENRRTIPWERGINVPEGVREPLIASLQVFQIGESGEGTHMKRCAAASGDAEYAQAVHLFIAEEQAHSAWMARALELLGAPLLRRHWSDVGFILLRRLMGLTCEVMVLLTAEVIGRNYFRAVHRGIDDDVLRTMLAQMISDEEAHIAFQVDRLRKSFAAMPRFMTPALRLAWWTLYHGAFVVVLRGHGSLLRAVNVSPGQFLRECDGTYHRVCAALFKGYALTHEAGARKKHATA